MPELTVWSSASLVIQIITLAMLIFAYVDYERRHDTRVHGGLTLVAYLLNMVTIIVIMVPAFFDGLADLGANPSELDHALMLIHVPLAVVATVLATYVIVRWVAYSFSPKACRGRRLMQATMITWSASIMFGIMIYLADLVG